MRVLITREENDAKRDAELFKRAGLEPVLLPLIRSRALDFEPPRGRYDYVVFQSRRAVRFFLERSRIPEGALIVAVGKKTALELKRFGHGADLVPEEESARGLLRLFEGLKRGRVLVPRSRIGRKELSEGLSGMGFFVEELEVYTVEEVLYERGELEGALRSDVALFYSPSAVSAFFANLQKNGIPLRALGLSFVAIGKTTKEALLERGVGEVLVSRSPSSENVLELLLRLARSLQ
ncbi:MAG: uroporphyrinogen-III synthase [Aquificae bacterium]|nr:uroporphyrinogen-III synthase [Aquificota bacterium]